MELEEQDIPLQANRKRRFLTKMLWLVWKGDLKTTNWKKMLEQGCKITNQEKVVTKPVGFIGFSEKGLFLLLEDVKRERLEKNP